MSLSSQNTNALSDLTFTIGTGVSIAAGDCMLFDVTNPYTTFPSYYTAFTSAACTITSGHSTTCSVTSSTEVQMLFNSASSTQTVTGKILSIRNPYSKVTLFITVGYYQGCTGTALNPLSSQFLTFVANTISTISLSSSSTTIGQTGVTLTVTFTPASVMKPNGVIEFKVPLWYQIGTSSTSYVLDRTSVVSSTSGITVSGSSFSLSSGTYSFTYSINSGNSLTSSNSVTLSFTNFKNPVTNSPLAGFQLFTEDINGNIADQSGNMSLSGVTTPASIYSTSAAFLSGSTIITSVGQTGTSLKISFTVNVPLQSGCYIKVTLPDQIKVDIDETVVSFTGTGFMTGTYSIAVGSFQKSQYGTGTNSLIMQGCTVTSQLGKAAQDGSVTISRFVSTTEVQTIGAISILVSTDSGMTVQIASGSFTPSITMTSNTITSSSMTFNSQSTSNIVQQYSDYTIQFTPYTGLFSTSYFQIDLPSGIILASTGLSCSISSAVNILSTASCTISSRTLTISSMIADTSTYGWDFSVVGSPAITMVVSIIGSTNPYSVTAAGSFAIRTYNTVSLAGKLVDSGSQSTSFTPVAGTFTSVTSVVTMSDSTTYSQSSTYSFTFILSKNFNSGSYLGITAPVEVGTSTNAPTCKQTLSTGTDTTFSSCVFTSGELRMQITTTNAASSSVTFKVSGFRNPRTTQKSSTFSLVTYDSSGNKIESGTGFFLTCDTAGAMPPMTITSISNTTNGATATYSFKFSSTSTTGLVPFANSDIISLQFPSDLSLAQVTSNSCGSTQSCSVTGQTLTVTVSQTSTTSFTYSFTVPNVKNPNSLRPSATFSLIQCNIKDSTTSVIYKVSALSSSSVTVTNSGIANILRYSISQNDTDLVQPATYTFTFTPSNIISSTGSIKLTWPSIVTIASTVTSTITTSSSYTSAHTVSTSTREIVYRNIFTSSYASQITIQLSPVINPKDSRYPAAFTLITYDDANQQYPIDQIGDKILYPTYGCNFSCATCNPTNKTDCYSCWSDLGQPYLYQTLYNKIYYGNCVSGCPSGYTSNGNSNSQCVGCDVSCATCQQKNTTGDKSKCVTCNPLYPFYSSSDMKCLTNCNGSYFQIDSKTCGICSSACSSCSGSSNYCTSCNAVNGVAPYVLDGTCVTSCPTGYTGINNTCVKCQSPCLTCAGAADKCLSCNTTTAAKYFYSYQCYTNCPNGTSTDNTTNKCVGCKAGCQICDNFDQATCVQCISGLLLFQGVCQSSCPSGYQTNFFETGCELVPQFFVDFPTVYFPFLIICLIMTVVVFIGYIRERKSLIISNIIAICGPVEFVAYIAVMGLSFLFSTWRYAIFAIAAVIIYVAINIAFTIYFSIAVGKHDTEFRRWKARYSRTYAAIISLSGILSFKLLKMFYSYFFGQDAHKANFSNKLHVQRSMIAFTCVHIFATNGLIILFDVSGLLKYTIGTQFSYTMIETGVIAILMLILELIEFVKLKEYLKDQPQYQEVYSDSVMNVSEMPPDDQSFDKKMRADMLKTIMGKVRGNQDLFLNNRLDDLFSKFGDRRCNSMTLFENDREGDPRMTKSEPVSPTGEATFDKDEYIKERWGDNVYAEAKPPNPIGKIGKTFSDADTQVRSSDMDKILARKGGDFVTFDGTDTARRKDKKSKRRGRKNQYYTQIDAEDDEEVDNNDDMMDGDDLDVIREEDEQEQMRQKEEKKRLKEQEEQERQKREEEEKQRKLQEEEEQQRIIKEKEQKALQERLEKERQEEYQRLELLRLQKQEEERLLKEQEELERKQKQDEEEELAKRQLEQQQQMLEIEDAGLGDQALGPQEEQQIESKGISPNKLSSHVPLEADPVHQVPENMSDLQSDKAGIHKDVLIEDSLNDFSKRLQDSQNEDVQIPPSASARNFNECDILGDFDRDEKGNVIVLQDEDGNYVDKQNRRVNERGYLIEQATGDIIENQKQRKMFDHKDIDERGEIPAPFCVEKYNFNPFLLRGNFDHDKQGRPQIPQNKQRELVDKQGSKVNKNGWLVDDNGNLCDVYGRKKFDRKQLQNDEMPKLFNYNGRRFDILDVCGIFDRDPSGAILMRRNKSGQLTDNLGRLVNEKGYLVDQNENIINKEGKKIFDRKHLKHGDFPKIFPFTKFKIKNVMGNFEMDPLGNPILDKNEIGDLVDRDGKIVNQRGYYINSNGDVIDKYGKIMFDKEILDEEGEIPKVFRTGLLKSDTASSLSRLMSEIERTQPFEEGGNDSEHQRIQNELMKYKQRGPGGGNQSAINNDQNTARRGSAGTSLDSMMGDTPSNYNIANQRFEAQQKLREAARVNRRNQQQIQEEEDDSVFDLNEDDHGLGKKRIKRKKKAAPSQPLKDPTDRDLLMARAYGGVARGQPKRQMMNNNQKNSNRMMTADSGGGRSAIDQRGLSKLAGSISGYQRDNPNNNHSVSRDRLEIHNFRDANVTNQSFLEGTNEPSIMAVPDHHIREQRLKQRKMNELKRKNKVAAAQAARSKRGLGGDPDFEKMFGKDIDEFLEDSDWDIESFGKMSNFSKGTAKSAFGDGRIRGLESIYLQRIETSMKKGGAVGGSKGGKQQQQSKAKFRVLQDRFMDDLSQVQHDNVARAEMSSGVSQQQPRTRNTRAQPVNRFMESANTTAMGQQRTDGNNMFAKVKPIQNQTLYN